jgi:hypothetical protein
MAQMVTRTIKIVYTTGEEEIFEGVQIMNFGTQAEGFISMNFWPKQMAVHISYDLIDKIYDAVTGENNASSRS